MYKKILVLGNGFDLAHGLPTQYKHFIEFCEKATLIYEEKKLSIGNNEYKKRYLNDWDFNNTIKQLLNDAFISRNYMGSVLVTNNLYLNQLYECIKNNLWYEHFKRVLASNALTGQNWIDFESEIANSIKEMEAAPNKRPLEQLANTSPTILQQYLSAIRKSVFLVTIKDLDNATLVLHTDLNRLTRALEIYLSVFVSKIKINKPIIDLENQLFDYVLSFNYTNTYERIFKKKITPQTEICYVHGKANKDATIENCNLVLGIDEYLLGDKKNTQLTFLPFKKFYQRIHKYTDNSYSKWIDDIYDCAIDGTRRNKFELHIFGHSLDVTDKDILRKFILNQNVQTKIYYHRKDEDDKSDLNSKIRNLLKIIEQDELVRRTGGGLGNTIEFIPQKVGV